MTTAGEDEKALDFVFIDQHRDNDRILFHDVNRIGFTQDWVCRMKQGSGKKGKQRRDSTDQMTYRTQS